MPQITQLERMSPIEDVLNWIEGPEVKARLTAANARAERVGAWLWIYFDEKPDEETRALLKANKFHWNPKRECWQHTGGKPSKHSPNDPRYKYDTEEIL